MTHPISRRQALSLLATAALSSRELAPAALAGREAHVSGSLAEIAARQGLLFGASMAAHELDKDYAAAYAGLYARECAIITPDLELKLWTLRPAPGVLDFSGADRIAGFAERAQCKLRGHTLIWNDYVPDWIKRLSGRETERLMRDHIAAVMARYKGRIRSWDVVNEPVAHWETNPGMLRTGPFYAALGEDYIAESFKAARAADPGARLILNEAWTERSDDIGLRSRAALLGLVRRMKEKDVPLDGIGLQSHLDASFAYDFDRYAAFVGELTAMGLEIEITELDVDDSRIGGTAPERDRVVASLYERYLKTLLANPAVTTVVTWQLADRTSGIGPGYAAKGMPLKSRPRPLPFDDDFRAKPARDAIARALSNAPRR